MTSENWFTGVRWTPRPYEEIVRVQNGGEPPRPFVVVGDRASLRFEEDSVPCMRPVLAKQLANNLHVEVLEDLGAGEFRGKAAGHEVQFSESDVWSVIATPLSLFGASDPDPLLVDRGTAVGVRQAEENEEVAIDIRTAETLRARLRALVLAAEQLAECIEDDDGTFAIVVSERLYRLLGFARRDRADFLDSI